MFDEQRRKRGFLTIGELLTLTDTDNVILDPYSVLLSAHAAVGRGNVFYPNVVVEASEQASVVIGDGNTFTPGCFFAASGGAMQVGDHNLFGDGGFTARTTSVSDRLEIGSHGRYINGPALSGRNALGSGSQVIGPIRVQGCSLAAGESHEFPKADARGAVLKGYGLARGIILEQGQVIAGRGDFQLSDLKMQSFYHPEAKGRT